MQVADAFEIPTGLRFGSVVFVLIREMSQNEQQEIISCCKFGLQICSIPFLITETITCGNYCTFSGF